MANDCPVTTCLPPGNCRPRTQRLQCCSAALTAAPLKRRRFRQLQFLPSIAAVTNDPAVTRGNLRLEPTTGCSAAVSALNNICTQEWHESQPCVSIISRQAGHWPRPGSAIMRERMDCGLQICGRRLFLQRCNCHRNELDPGPGQGWDHTSLQYTSVQTLSRYFYFWTFS